MRFSEIFGRGLALRLEHRYIVSGAVVLHHGCMVNRNFRGTVFKVAGRIAAVPPSLSPKV